MIGHCIICGKGYKRWKWIHHHFNKHHPNHKGLYRITEIWDAMNKEAEEFAKLPRIEW